MDYKALLLFLPLFLPLPSSLRLHPLSIAYAEILFVTSGRKMACLTCIWERMGVQCALPPCPRRRWNRGGKNASHGPARKCSPYFFLPSQFPTPFMLFPSSIYYVSRRSDHRVPQTFQLMWNSGRIVLFSFISCCYLTEMKQLFRADYQE